MKNSRILCLVVLFLLSVEILYGCGAFFAREESAQTKIVAVKWGKTKRITEFKVGGLKPAGHIIWDNDVRDGARCRVSITNIAKAIMVYRYDFTYQKSSAGKGYNYFRGPVIEYISEWELQMGRYLLELYVDGRRISHESFSILP